LLTILDLFSKVAHFILLSLPYMTTTVARTFFDIMVRLHGIPNSIVFDHDLVFTSNFWYELFSLAGMKLNLSSAFHPQSDGKAKATNKIIWMYLRCLTGDRSRDWLQWLSWTEFCYNSAFQSVLRTSPFRVVYGWDLSSLRVYTPREARLSVVRQQMEERNEFIVEIRECLHQS
jgi:hypothetical protein